MKNIVRINSKISPYNKIIEIPGDKSISIRCMLLASQAIGISRIFNLLKSGDVNNTIKSLKKLGIKIYNKENYTEVIGVGLNGFNFKNNITIDAGNSGTFARLVCGLLAKTNKSIKLVGDDSLSNRDFSRIIHPLRLFGVNFKTKNNKLPMHILGSNYLKPIIYKEKLGSAQVKSAIMIASLNTPGVTKIISVPSRNHTEIMFKSCLNIPIRINKKKKVEEINIKGQNNYKSFDYKIPGDISSAAFLIVLTILSKNSKLLIKNVNVNETRSGIIILLKKMNAKIKISNKKNYKGEKVADIQIASSSKLRAINCPKELNTKTIDEFLILFLVCAKAKGVSKFVSLGELRQKESDRLKIASNFLKSIGVNIRENKSALKIYGNPQLEIKKKITIKNFLKDHRVFMMSCIAALTLGGHFTIYDKDSINSSFPNFIKILKKLGARII